MSDLLRFDGAVKRAPAIEEWMRAQPSGLRELAQPWFERMRRCGDDVLELLHDGCPTVCVQDAPFAYVAAFRAHVDVGFFHGAFLDDPAGLLEGTGKRMRHVKLRPGEAVDATALARLVEASYRDIGERLSRG
jgi:hypothetical protein